METERPASPRSLPRNIGRYRIVGRLGKGAMGVVYSAHDSLMERSVAIKVMMTDLEEDPETSARFYREARSAGQLVHPNIITIFDMGEDDGRPFIVMELLEGETLNKYLQRPEAADIEGKIDLMIQICDGLYAAHTHGIFHRDVKPGNLLVRPNGELKIVDFGIARLASSSMTASGLMVGTPDYMSPEQARGQEVDQRSDIFSAGTVFYLMLTGRKPFAAPDLTAVLAKVQGEDPLPIRDTEAPAPLARLVRKALAKDPADRYQTCAEVAAELEHLKRDLEIETSQWVEECGQRLQVLESLANQRRTLIAALDIVPAPADIEATRVALLGKRASLSARYRRGAVADLRAEIMNVHESAAEQVDRWQRALKSVEDGARAAAAGRTRDAIPQFELALRIEPSSKRASAEADRCRRTAAEQRVIVDRAKALLDEARKAAAAKQWQAAIALCSEALLLDSSAEEAAALKRKAVEAIESEARERKLECDRALGRAEAHRRKNRFQEAMLEVERARGFNPNATELHVFEERLRASIAQTERETQLAQEAAGIIAAARQAFSSGQRDQAIADLRSFQARAPQTAIAAEISRLEAEAKRIAVAEQRAAEAAEQATAAEAAFASGNPQQALELATRALAIDPGHVVARKVSGLAGAEVKQQAEAKARAAAAERHIEEAKQQIGPRQVPEGSRAGVDGGGPEPREQSAHARPRAYPGRGGTSRGRGRARTVGTAARKGGRAHPRTRARRGSAAPLRARSVDGGECAGGGFGLRRSERNPAARESADRSGSTARGRDGRSHGRHGRVGRSGRYRVADTPHRILGSDGGRVQELDQGWRNRRAAKTAGRRLAARQDIAG